MTDARKGVTA